MTTDRFLERSRIERRRRWKRIGIAVLAAAIASLLVWLIWFSSVLAVRGVEIAGRTTLKEGQVMGVAQVPVGRPLARVDLAAIEGRVAALPRVDTVEVSRSWPRTVSISIVERRAVVWMSVAGRIRGIDRHGVDYRSYSSAPKSLLEARIAATEPRDRQQASEAVGVVVELIAGSDPALRQQIQSVSAASKDSIELDLTDGRTVVWGSRADGERKLAVLRSLLTIKASHYDISAPERPTTRP